MIKKYLLDTNIIVRLIVKDDQKLFLEAQNIFKEIEGKIVEGYVSLLVLDETIWVLENYYEIARKDYIPALEKIISLKNIKILETSKNKIENILRRMENSKIDFTDYYLASLSKDFEVKSFDKDLEKIKS